MAGVSRERMTAEMDGEFVVFLIGMRVNKFWKVNQWLPVAMAMPRMIRELEKNPECGYLGSRSGIGFMVQYWRSFEHLEAYARSRDREHWPAWVAFNKRIGSSGTDVGIWHETYRISPGQYEAFYRNVPPRGLGKAGRLMPVGGRGESARERMAPTRPSTE